MGITTYVLPFVITYDYLPFVITTTQFPRPSLHADNGGRL